MRSLQSRTCKASRLLSSFTHPQCSSSNLSRSSLFPFLLSPLHGARRRRLRLQARLPRSPSLRQRRRHRRARAAPATCSAVTRLRARRPLLRQVSLLSLASLFRVSLPRLASPAAQSLLSALAEADGKIKLNSTVKLLYRHLYSSSASAVCCQDNSHGMLALQSFASSLTFYTNIRIA